MATAMHANKDWRQLEAGLSEYEHAMLHGREDTLPEDLRENGNVKKGTVLMFSRDSAGRLKGKANGHPLVEVHSSKLCQVKLPPLWCQLLRLAGLKSTDN